MPNPRIQTAFCNSGFWHRKWLAGKQSETEERIQDFNTKRQKMNYLSSSKLHNCNLRSGKCHFSFPSQKIYPRAVCELSEIWKHSSKAQRVCTFSLLKRGSGRKRHQALAVSSVQINNEKFYPVSQWLLQNNLPHPWTCKQPIKNYVTFRNHYS